MTDVPKIVYDRLRAGVPAQDAYGQSHPDADLLTAFTEQALPTPERDGVLKHLALCGDCREVVALALPEADLAGASIASDADRDRATGTRVGAPHKAALSWPTLRWAALAAAIVVVASVLLVRPGKLNPPAPGAVNPQVATVAPSASGLETAVATDGSSPIASPEVSQSTAKPATAGRQPNAGLPVFKKSKAAPTATQADSGMLLARNGFASYGQDSGGLNRPAIPTPPNAAFSYEASPGPAKTETIETSSRSAAVETQTSGAHVLIAQNDAPAVEKAKPAMQDAEESKQQKTSTPTANVFAKTQRSSSRDASKIAVMAGAAFRSDIGGWAIRGGTLQRSLDNGATWQEALHADHPLSYLANYGGDLWAGGQAGTLFHSADGGATWVQVQPVIGSVALTSDITNIQASAAAVVVVSTSGDGTWTSSDSGKTWTKK